MQKWMRIKQCTFQEKPRTRANFRYHKEFYNNTSVTNRTYYQTADNTDLRDVYLVISLPDAPFDGNYYKFIAGIFEP